MLGARRPGACAPGRFRLGGPGDYQRGEDLATGAYLRPRTTLAEHQMKGMDQKKQDKKKPAKTMKEKKAAKKEKSAGKKAFAPV